MCTLACLSLMDMSRSTCIRKANVSMHDVYAIRMYVLDFQVALQRRAYEKIMYMSKYDGKRIKKRRERSHSQPGAGTGKSERACLYKERIRKKNTISFYVVKVTTRVVV
ncbi:hypothetical protein BCR43DRAFT_499518 [Syncephalastrum racemosum]|uniref:Uncharacterized protein n=1 Tax=Syncephalastrum racemosum TaxID=13706 RepID=A0A1X2H0I1_SYNRA|nr:hypothetical protein BCR43DRAFT_499518 [Syncephalastrum racemosum]